MILEEIKISRISYDNTTQLDSYTLNDHFRAQ